MNGCDDVRLQLGGYVLDGLEPDEVAAVEAHLATCPRCRHEAAELGELPALLELASAAERRAPEDLRGRVLRRPTVARRRLPWTVAAALILVAALTGASLTALLDHPPTPDAALELHSERPVGIVGDAELRQVASGVQVDLRLRGVGAATDGYYHVWLHRGDRRVSAGTFIGTPDGRADVRLLCGGQLPNYDRLTVTWHGRDRDAEVVAVDADLPQGDPDDATA